MGLGIAAAAVGAAGAIGGALISSSSKGSGGSQSSTNSTAPWAPQQPYITGGLADAQTNYEAQKAAGPYTGTFTAGPSAEQGSAIAQASGWANGSGAAIPGQTAATAATLQGASPAFVNNASSIAQNGIAGPNQGDMATLQGYASGATPAVSVDPALSGALNSNAITAANNIGALSNGAVNTVNKGLNAGGTAQTQQLANDAGTYMNSAPVQAELAATNAGINQTLNEQALPGVDRQAAQGGDLNSTRTAMSEGMARQGAATATGQADASILNNSFNLGLSTAASTNNAGLSGAAMASSFGLGANNTAAQSEQGQQVGQSQFGTNTAIGASNAALGAGLNYSTAGINAKLGANGQLGTAANLGINGATAATGQAASDYNLGASAGNLQQAGAQSTDTNALQQWQMQNGYQQGILGQYMDIVGHPYGTAGAGSSVSTLGQSPFSNALGGAAGAMGLFKNATGGGNYGGGNYGGGSFGPFYAFGSNGGIANMAAGYNWSGTPSSSMMTNLSNQAAGNSAGGAAGL